MLRAKWSWHGETGSRSSDLNSLLLSGQFSVTSEFVGPSCSQVRFQGWAWFLWVTGSLTWASWSRSWAIRFGSPATTSSTCDHWWCWLDPGSGHSTQSWCSSAFQYHDPFQWCRCWGWWSSGWGPKSIDWACKSNY